MFKEIPGLSGYLVNPKGIVISKKTHKRLRGCNNGNGYIYVQLKDKKNYYIHRLVATTFIPNPDKRPYVDHVDGNKANNCAYNLRWITASENYYGFGFAERAESRRVPVTAENIITNQIIEFRSRNACANYFRCDKSKIKYGWIYRKGSKKNWILSQANR